MIARSFVLMVARHIDRATGLTIASEVVGARGKILETIVEDRRISDALGEAVKRTAPVYAGRLLADLPVRSAKRVGAVIVRAVYARIGTKFLEKRLWGENEEAQQILRRTFSAYLDELCGVVRQTERDDDHFEALQAILLAKLGEADARLRTLLLRWGSLMSEPENLLSAARTIGGLAPGDRQQALVETISRIAELEDQPAPRVFAEMMTLVATPPAAKA